MSPALTHGPSCHLPTAAKPLQGWGLHPFPDGLIADSPGSFQGKFAPLQQGLNPLSTWFYPHSHNTDSTTPPESVEV